MKWSNLKNIKCPQCSSALIPDTEGDLFKCHTCQFMITKTKFEKVVNNLYKPSKRAPDEDNLSALNNLGHEKVAEDFSDSPFLDY